MSDTAQSTEKKNTFACDQFPFPRLRLGNVESKFGFTLSTQFGTTHLNTFLADADGKLEAYCVRFPTLTGGPISYYIATDGGGKPALYLRQDVHAQWSAPGPDGQVSRKRLARGIQVEEFWQRFQARCTELLRELKQQELMQLMGHKQAKDLENCLGEPVTFPTYDAKHRFANMPNEERSPQFKTVPWMQEMSKMKEETRRKMEGSRAKDNLMIPGTDIVVYTRFYDLTPSSPCPGKRISDWAHMKRFCYNKDHNENASDQYCQVMAHQTIQAPSLVFNPGKHTTGEIQSKPEEVYFTGFNQRVRDGTLSEDKVAEEKRKRQEDADDLGFVQGGDDEMQEQQAESAVNKRIKHNDGILTQLGGHTTATNVDDDDITALGLQDEYDQNRQAYGHF